MLNLARRHTPRSVASDPVLQCLPVAHNLNGLILFCIGQTLALLSLGISLSMNSVINVVIVIYTMHTKFSNCFVRVSPLTSDLKSHLLS